MWLEHWGDVLIVKGLKIAFIVFEPVYTLDLQEDYRINRGRYEHIVI